MLVKILVKSEALDGALDDSKFGLPLGPRYEVLMKKMINAFLNATYLEIIFL